MLRQCCRQSPLACAWPGARTLAVDASELAGSPAESSTGQHARSVDDKEVRRFTALSAEWWNPRGPFQALHALNVARVTFACQAIRGHFGDGPSRRQAGAGASCDSLSAAQRAHEAHDHPTTSSAGLGGRAATARHPLHGLRIVDVGCGGGIFAESLARLGARVTGVDASPESIEVARAHAAIDPSLQDRLQYNAEPAEALVDRGERFDVVVSSEVIEHVSQPDQFCDTLAALCREDGCVIVTTMNRTPASYALAIVAAERVLGLLPRGTHDWHKFITPEELHVMFAQSGFKLNKLAGMSMGLQGSWQLTNWTDVNYAAMLTKT